MKQYETKVDHLLIAILLALFIVSLFVVYSASGQYQPEDPFYYVRRQAIWYIVSFSIMAAASYFDYELLERWAMPLYFIGIGLLILVHFFGTFKNGSQRWISFGLFEIQPSEFVKVFLVLVLSRTLNKLGDKKLTFIESIPVTLKLIFFTAIPFLLILVQPDLGSSLVIMAVFFALIIVSGISYKMILFLVSNVVALIGFLVFLYNYSFDTFIKIIKPHQLERFYGWLSPEAFASSYGYQLMQAQRGIGSGQMTGWGFNQGKQVQSGMIPEVHTDFIFTAIGEEFGFIGATVIISLYFLLIYRMVMIALRANTLFGIYIIVGAIGLISFQVFQNISMTIGLMPITGLALPFISYGGSALLTNMMVIGIVLSVSNHSKDYMFSSR